MMQIMDLAEAQTRHWDVILGGSSFASMFFLRGLPEGTSVLVLEKGPVHTHDEFIAARRVLGREDIAMTNSSGAEKEWVAHATWGGNSNCWWACTPRFMPADFALASRYGVGVDWPFGYDELEPYYAEVERLMQIAGGGSDAYLPRSEPFPFPPHAPSRTDRLFRAHSPGWFAQPTARANGGTRAQCCANGVCAVCPVDSKFTTSNSEHLFTRPEVFALPGVELRQVARTGGRASGVVARGPQGDVELTADLVGLGCNALHNAAILMRSGVDDPGLGRGIHEQTSVWVELAGDGLGYYGGTSITGHGYDLYDGPHRADSAAVLIEVHNAPITIRRTPGKWAQAARLKLIAEDLPQARNRVVLNPETGAPTIEWHGYSDYARAGLDRAIAALPGILPAGIEITHVSPPADTEAHIIGTHPMGRDPMRAVTGDDLQVHSLPGAYALGSGAFPSSSPANPTLTLAALSLRAARGLA